MQKATTYIQHTSTTLAYPLRDVGWYVNSYLEFKVGKAVVISSNTGVAAT